MNNRTNLYSITDEIDFDKVVNYLPSLFIY